MSDRDFNSNSGCLLKVAALALLAFGGFWFFGNGALFGGGELEDSIAENKKVIAGLEGQLDAAQKKMEAHKALEAKVTDLAVLDEKVKSKMASIAGFEVSIAELQKEILASEKAHDDYVERYRQLIRAADKGKELDALTTIDGTMYHDVKITKIDAAGMSIIHRNGSRRIPYKILPVKMQKYYQFDQDEATTLLKRERERRRQYYQAQQALAANQVEASNPQGEADRELKDEANTRLQIEAIAEQISSLESAIRSMRGKISAEGGKTISKAPQYRRQLSTLESSKRVLEDKMRRLRASQ